MVKSVEETAKNSASPSNVAGEQEEAPVEAETEAEERKPRAGVKSRASPASSAGRRVLLLAMKCEWGGMEQALKTLENSLSAVKSNSASESPSKTPLAGIVDEVLLPLSSGINIPIDSICQSVEMAFKWINSSLRLLLVASLRAAHIGRN